VQFEDLGISFCPQKFGRPACFNVQGAIGPSCSLYAHVPIAIYVAVWSTSSLLAAVKLKKAAANIINKSSKPFSGLTESLSRDTLP
jgi:hypothetical protein